MGNALNSCAGVWALPGLVVALEVLYMTKSASCGGRIAQHVGPGVLRRSLKPRTQNRGLARPGSNTRTTTVTTHITRSNKRLGIVLICLPNITLEFGAEIYRLRAFIVIFGMRGKMRVFPVHVGVFFCYPVFFFFFS